MEPYPSWVPSLSTKPPSNWTLEEQSLFKEEVDRLSLILDQRKDQLVTLFSQEYQQGDAIERTEDALVLQNAINSGEDMREKRQLVELLELRDKVISKFQTSSNKHSELLMRSIDLEKDIKDARTDCEKLETEYKDLTTKSTVASSSDEADLTSDLEQQERRMDRELEILRARNEIISNVLRGVIVGSGIRWANSEEYVELLKSCENVDDDDDDEEEEEELDGGGGASNGEAKGGGR
ncbi:hypothetical protein HK102_002676 [Quaeritorhiza haematococci]|nr:hypothetical protein HK102_002676 [Quaeritorhiza haematococci]